MTVKRKVLFAIIDGWGIGKNKRVSAIHYANTPNMDELASKAANAATLSASGLSVGLPSGVMGNSEVGHLTIGAGSVLQTDIVRINQAVTSDTLKDNKAVKSLFSAKPGSSLHFVGLCSKSSVHSHLDHLQALLRSLQGPLPFNRIILHLITDGRDSSPMSAPVFVKDLFEECAPIQARLAKQGVGLLVGSFGGRYFYMDRDKRSERTDQAFAAIVDSSLCAEPVAKQLDKEPSSWEETEQALLTSLEKNYSSNVTDEFLVPTKVGRNCGAVHGDTLFFFNFRADRMRQLVAKFLSAVDESPTSPFRVVTMTSFAGEFSPHVDVVFPLQFVQRPLAERVAASGAKQLHIAETEKYAHVTYFFNGRQEQPFEKESRKMLSSPKTVATYDLAPGMAMADVADAAVAAIHSDQFSFVVLNLAAPDMVGHTGNFSAAVLACALCDEQIGKLRCCCKETGWVFAVTADHGNAEIMVDQETGEKVTSHTCSDVPFFVEGFSEPFSCKEGSLADVAPTLAHIMGIGPPGAARPKKQ